MNQPAAQQQTPAPAGDRRAELAARLAAVRTRVEGAARAAGRAPQEVTVVVVTKYFPADDICRLVELGVSDVAENRDQEAAAKLAELPAEVRRKLTVHFVGQVQTNKAASVSGYADVVHSVDRARLVQALGRATAGRQRPLEVLLQVSLDLQQGRGGADPAVLSELADQVTAAPQLRLRGLMAVAPLGGDPDRAFARLAELHTRIRAEYPGADWLSAGMSGDLESAVAHGATHLRVGTAILGSRPALG